VGWNLEADSKGGRGGTDVTGVAVTGRERAFCRWDAAAGQRDDRGRGGRLLLGDGGGELDQAAEGAGHGGPHPSGRLAGKAESDSGRHGLIPGRP